jgi:hypothetical protein
LVSFYYRKTEKSLQHAEGFFVWGSLKKAAVKEKYGDHCFRDVLIIYFFMDNNVYIGKK